MLNKISILFLIFAAAALPQQEEMMTVMGDSLIGRTIAGEMIREVYGNVVITQGDVIITCNRATQFISRNSAELIGDVVVRQDSLTITTPRGFYYGNERRAESNSGVKLDDQKVILTAIAGEYFFNEDRAFFQDSVKLYDTVTTLTSQELTYFKNEDRSVAVGGVKIVDKENTIYADTLRHDRISRITIADNNVEIINNINHVSIYGNHLEDYNLQNYSLINQNPLLVQIDSSYVAEIDSLGNEITVLKIDTLVIKSLIMEAFRDTQNIFEAKDSVQIWRGTFASRNDYSIYFRDEEKIITNKVEGSRLQPILWNENTQLTGDSITIFLRDNRIFLLEVDANAFILSQNEDYFSRFDQVSGEKVKIYFSDDGIRSTEVYDGVLSIYYMYEEDYPNGLTRSSSQSAVINFEDKKVSEVKLYGSPASEYYPEPQVKGKELSFTLPRYIYYTNRPQKANLLQGINQRRD